MKIIQTFNFIVLVLLISLVWLVDQNSKGLSEHSEQEAKTSIELKKHTQVVLSGEKKETVDHLLAVMQRLSSANYSGAKAIKGHAESLKGVRNIALGLIILQLSLLVLYYIQHRKSLSQTDAKDTSPD